MSPHLSALVIDELAAGLPSADAAAHLATCTECQQRLAAVKQASATISAMPAFQQRLDAVTLGEPARRGPWLRLVSIALPVAAALALVVFWPRGDDVLLKGAPTVELIANEKPVMVAKPGDRVTLAVGGAGATHAIVFGVDASGTVTKLWPAGGEAAPIAPGARVSLDVSFEVTPGDLVLLGFFTKTTQPTEPIREAIERSVAGARAPLEVLAPSGFGAVARSRLKVTP
ncbi:MAG: hypothetical protein GQE15_28040 [Archangiaceae bacterium]|nr:hypothetical protein [Archangiaceae bacterium]